jgi:5'-deoxynucleotidase YfbR-like HD superfamily hydrolase
MGLSKEKLTSRETKLSIISRYGRFPMNYPQSLLMHSFSVSAVFKYIVLNSKHPIFNNVDLKTGLILCDIHDDDEIFLGDFPSNMKEKLTTTQKLILSNIEQNTAKHLYSQYSDTQGENYYNNLIRVGKKSCLESQLVSYADRIVGLSEMVHETISGNHSLIKLDNVHTNYQSLFQTLNPKLDKLIPFFNSSDNLNFTSPTSLISTIQTLNQIVKNSKGIVFDKTNILTSSNISIYEHYKKALFSQNNSQATDILCNLRKRKKIHSNNYYLSKLNSLFCD